MTQEDNVPNPVFSTTRERRILELKQQLAELEGERTAQDAIHYYCGTYFPRPKESPQSHKRKTTKQA